MPATDSLRRTPPLGLLFAITSDAKTAWPAPKEGMGATAPMPTFFPSRSFSPNEILAKIEVPFCLLIYSHDDLHWSP